MQGKSPGCACSMDVAVRFAVSNGNVCMYVVMCVILDISRLGRYPGRRRAYFGDVHAL
jgi:hypothetical protein